MANKSAKELWAELFALEPIVETPWTWQERVSYRLTGRVAPRIYAERMIGLAEAEAKTSVLIRLCREAEARERIEAEAARD